MSNNVFSFQRAAEEAERCLQCFDAPCIQACPVRMDIPTFIMMIKSGNVRGAAEVVKSANALANACGKVCPEEIYCQSACNRTNLTEPIRIRELHFFATQQEARSGYSPLKKFPRLAKRVAVIGGGPAGLSAAFELAKFGYRVTLFDSRGTGGVPKQSIPAFRLDEKELSDDIAFLSKHFTLKKDHVTPAKLAQLRTSFDAVYVGIGLGKDRPIGIPGENLNGVYPVLQFLEAAKAGSKKLSLGKRVVVVGGGNVSLDAAATAKRLGAEEVVLIYRRSEREMKVWKSELEEARKQGVEIRVLTSPVEIVGTRSVSGIRCRQNTLSKKIDASGRPVPVEVEGSDFLVHADSVIIAIGQSIGAEIAEQFKKSSAGFIAVDAKYRTCLPGVFAGGDAISGEGTIVQSVAHGKHAAHAIHNYLTNGARAKKV